MQAAYKILGGDGQEYGPATLEQMLAWVREGRVNATTQVWRSDQTAWLNAAQLPELQIPPQPIPFAYAVGMALYLLDGVIFAVASDWLAAAFHAFVLFRLFSGFRAAQQLNSSV